MSGVGSTEPPSRRRLDGAGQGAEAAASRPPEREESGAPPLPARERE
jgi:hypothetical protein